MSKAAGTVWLGQEKWAGAAERQALPSILGECLLPQQTSMDKHTLGGQTVVPRTPPPGTLGAPQAFTAPQAVT